MIDPSSSLGTSESAVGRERTRASESGRAESRPTEELGDQPLESDSSEGSASDEGPY